MPLMPCIAQASRLGGSEHIALAGFKKPALQEDIVPVDDRSTLADRFRLPTSLLTPGLDRAA
jgi:hypothetical protein